MQNTDVIAPTLMQYLVQLPIYLVWLAGIVLALRHRNHAPRTSILAIAAFAIFFVRSFVVTFLNVWLPLLLTRSGWPIRNVSLAMTTTNFVSAVIGAVAWALLIWALVAAWNRVYGGNTS